MTDAGASDPRRLLGQVIAGRYRIDSLIGEGGMGAVYRAEHTAMRKRLAVKVLHPEMLGMAEVVERFEREAIAGAHIEHPNVAAASDFGKLEDGSHYLVMEFLEGEDLRNVIGRGPVPPDRALRIARQVAMALRAAHQLGIVHRDLKPENVMLVQKERDGELVKVLDFGIAKVPVDELAASRRRGVAAPITQLGMVYGTPEYMAPEQAAGGEIDGRADLYALGVILYEMLCGARPFDAATRAQLLGMVASSEPPRLADKGASVPAGVEAIVMRLLEKRASARYQRADEVVEAIEVVMLELDWPIAARVASAADRSGAQRAVLPSIVELPVPARTVEAAPPTSRDAVGAPGAGRVGLAALGLVAIGAVVGAALWLRSTETLRALEQAEVAGTPAASAQGPVGGASASAAAGEPEPVGTAASITELATAKDKGLAALGALAQKYPDDPAVLEALMVAHARDRAGYPQALGLVARVVEKDPRRAEDDAVRQTLLRIANGPPESADAALDLLSHKMGSAGPDLLYELIIAPGVGKYPQSKAAALLQKPDVLDHTTPALKIANELRVATACGKKPLFKRAEKDGDARSLGYLTPLLATTGCGFIFKNNDCYPCLTNRADLRAAIDAIQARAKK